MGVRAPPAGSFGRAPRGRRKEVGRQEFRQRPTLDDHSKPSDLGEEGGVDRHGDENEGTGEEHRLNLGRRLDRAQTRHPRHGPQQRNRAVVGGRRVRDVAEIPVDVRDARPLVAPLAPRAGPS